VGVQYMAGGRLEEAAAALANASALHPWSPYPPLNLAIVALKRGTVDQKDSMQVEKGSSRVVSPLKHGAEMLQHRLENGRSWDEKVEQSLARGGKKNFQHTACYIVRIRSIFFS
jgi:hypothetical protein